MRRLDDVPLKPQDRAAIEAAARIARERFSVEEVVLFGSKARGTDDPESDIDLLLLTSRSLSWRERDALTDALFDVEFAHDVVISTLVVPREEWEHGPSIVLPIHDEIESHGVAA